MALKDSFITFDGSGAFLCHGTQWYYQTFTTTSAYSITGVALNCWKFGSPGNITVSIRAVDDNGKPTDEDLAAVTVADSVISVLPTLLYYTFTFASSYTLSDATKYAIVARAPSGDGGNYFQALGHGGSEYANGGSAISVDSGSSWGAESTTTDANFKTYGETPVPSKPVNPTPSDAASDVTLDQATITWEDGGNADTYDIYYGDTSGDLTLVSEGQVGLSFTISDITLGSPFDYIVTRYWRVDAVNAFGTTTGDEWSFVSIAFDQIQVSYKLISGGNGQGPYDDPAGVQGTDWEYTGESNMTTIKRLVAAANDKIWYESI